jgi:uncharacterized RDD family membrane protein YckC
MKERLDTISIVEAPEGVELALRVAGPSARTLAFLIDFLVRIAIFSAMSWLLLFGGVGQALYLLSLFAVEWFYPVLFEIYWHGQTPGKRALGLAVVRDDGTPVGWSASVLRNFLRVVDFLPGLYGVAIVSAGASRGFKRIGDHVAGTLVIHVGRAPKALELPEVAPFAPRVALTKEEQEALLEFGARSRTWTKARAEELAGELEPLTEAVGAEGRQRVLGMARWIEGAR